MKTLTVVLFSLLTTGCAGLDVEWQMQATYLSDELKAKRAKAKDDAGAEAYVDAMIAKARAK